MTKETRIVKDSMGEMQVPKEALYGAQTQRAIENFPISQLSMPAPFIQALGLIKSAAATVNESLGLLASDKAKAIVDAAGSIAEGKYLSEFPLDVFQTGSGTSSNMNANEVIAQLATQRSGINIHPNDDVNMSQSSNDVIPTAIHVSTSIMAHHHLLGSLKHLHQALLIRSKELENVTKTGRTHLMDAMPVTFGQELGGYAAQIQADIERIESTLPHLCALAIGGTAVGTGINAHPEFGKRVVQLLAEKTGVPFTVSKNYFASLSSQDAAVAFSGQLKTTAVSLTKISNDLRWMNSGPIAGLGEIFLPSLQPGSSIMPGKVNPVIPEAVMMVCAQITGNDTTITFAGQSGNFQLNVMLPVIGYNLLQSIDILGNAAKMLADKAIAGFTINESHVHDKLARNPILVTALNTVIGYELGAKIVKKAYEKKAPLMEVALEMTDLSEDELRKILDPSKLTQGGLPEG